jgi:hypothetical protein
MRGGQPGRLAQGRCFPRLTGRPCGRRRCREFFEHYHRSLPFWAGMLGEAITDIHNGGQSW